MPFYATITITTALVPWERICLHFGTVERWTLCFGMTCVSPYSAGIRCNMVVFSAFVGTVRSLGMHLWLFFWIVLFCWNSGGVYVCVFGFSSFCFFLTTKKLLFRLAHTIFLEVNYHRIKQNYSQWACSIRIWIVHSFVLICVGFIYSSSSILQFVEMSWRDVHTTWCYLYVLKKFTKNNGRKRLHWLRSKFEWTESLGFDDHEIESTIYETMNLTVFFF